MYLQDNRVKDPAGKVLQLTNSSLHRELHSILGLKIDTAEEECKQSSSRAAEQQHTYVSMLKQGSSLLQAGVSLVKSGVIGNGEEAEVDAGAQKPNDQALDEADKAREALEGEKEKMKALVIGSTPHKGFQAPYPALPLSQACGQAGAGAQKPDEGGYKAWKALKLKDQAPYPALPLSQACGQAQSGELERGRKVKRKELVKGENDERLEKVRSWSTKTEETLKVLQVNGERLRQGMEELRKTQEELVLVAVRENEEREVRVLRKNEERVEGLRRENRERVEELRKQEKELVKKQRTKSEEAEEKLSLENGAKEENLEATNKEKEKQLKKENMKKEDNLRKRNERALNILKQGNEKALAELTTRAKERDDQILKENEEMEKQLERENKIIEEEQRTKNEMNLAILVTDNESRMTQILTKEKEEEGEKILAKEEKEEKRVGGRKRKADQLEVATKKEPAAPECPVCAPNKIISKYFDKYFTLLHLRCVLKRWRLPPRSSSVAAEVTLCASLASN